MLFIPLISYEQQRYCLFYCSGTIPNSLNTFTKRLVNNYNASKSWAIVNVSCPFMQSLSILHFHRPDVLVYLSYTPPEIEFLFHLSDVRIWSMINVHYTQFICRFCGTYVFYPLGNWPFGLRNCLSLRWLCSIWCIIID